MPALLNYSIVTDPTSLPASQPGMPSVGSVYVVVSNTHLESVMLNSLEVEVSGDLTSRPQDVSASADIDPPNPGVKLDFRWDSGKKVFRIFPPPKFVIDMSPGDSIVLKMENIVVSDTKGLAFLKIREVSSGGDAPGNIVTPAPPAGKSRSVTHALVKSTPKVPRNFRPDTSMVNGDAAEDVTLRWDGPDNLTYWIQSPDGQKVRVSQAASGPGVTQRSYVWKVSPKRGATYTLLAGTENPAQEGYFLTTTVHARIPEFESGTRTPWVEGTTDRGRVTFSAQGAEIRDRTGTWGTLTVGEARLMRGLRTAWVWGLNDEDGWISFPSTGINVYHGRSRNWGTVEAGKADLNELLTGEGRVKGHLVVDGGMNLSHEGQRIFQSELDRITFHAFGDFQKSILVYGGGVITYDHGTFSIGESHGGAIISCDLQVNGKLSMPSGDARRIRYL
ncbi:hypothetical protein [Streptomyces sp. SBT349]|uniref:hypothetical protein n=1 Tax=Streptomyces sp. SBT349 TaxID=1580539 RepID=UPI00066CE055|nr:hypothetical protein [Streptomyces sp. SBT349]